MENERVVISGVPAVEPEVIVLIHEPYGGGHPTPAARPTDCDRFRTGDREAYRRRVEELLEDFRPELLRTGSVDRLMEQYRGREELLIARIEKHRARKMAAS